MPSVNLSQAVDILEANRTPLHGLAADERAALIQRGVAEIRPILDELNIEIVNAALTWTDDQRLECLMARSSSSGSVSTIALEIGIVALRTDGSGQTMPVSDPDICRPAYQLSQRLARRRDAERCQQVEREWAGKNAAMQLAMTHLGDLKSSRLSAHEKTALVLKGLETRARFDAINRLYTVPKLVQYPFKFAEDDQSVVTKFFKKNLVWTAQDLFGVIERCAELPRESSSADDKSHARNATTFKKLLPSMKKVLKELGMTRKVPALK